MHSNTREHGPTTRREVEIVRVLDRVLAGDGQLEVQQCCDARWVERQAVAPFGFGPDVQRRGTGRLFGGGGCHDGCAGRSREVSRPLCFACVTSAVMRLVTPVLSASVCHAAVAFVA